MLAVCSGILLLAYADLLPATKVTPAPDEAKLSGQGIPDHICQTQQWPNSQERTKFVNAVNQSSLPKGCDTLDRLDGMRIDGVDDIYLCTVDLPWEAEHPLAVYQKEANILAKKVMMGKHFAVLLLAQGSARAPFEVERHKWVIHTQAQLQSLDIELETPQAALAWGFLRGVFGQGVAKPYASEAMCGANMSYEGQRWQVGQVTVFKNCQPKEKISAAIAVNGEIEILEQKVLKNQPILCID